MEAMPPDNSGILWLKRQKSSRRVREEAQGMVMNESEYAMSKESLVRRSRELKSGQGSCRTQEQKYRSEADETRDRRIKECGNLTSWLVCNAKRQQEKDRRNEAGQIDGLWMES